MQAVQRHIRGSSPNTGCEVLPLPGVYGFSVEVVNFAAHEADRFVGKVGRRKIVEEVNPIEGMGLLPVREVHGCWGAREKVERRKAGSLISIAVNEYYR